MNDIIRQRAYGSCIGAAVGDALGMPLEFGPRRPISRLVREMMPGRIPAGTFTDDTEMALALAESLVDFMPLNAPDLAARFVVWYRSNPPDIGIHTRSVLSCVAGGMAWDRASAQVQQHNPESAGNGSVMRCWPVALAHWNNLEQLQTDSRLQSQTTHLHEECQVGCAFVNVIIYYLLHGALPAEAVAQAGEKVALPAPLQEVVNAAPHRQREELRNTGWIRHTLESAVWGLLTTTSFEEAVVQVVNLGDDADTAGAVVGALAGAAYGLDAIPQRWQRVLCGEWPVQSAWDVDRLCALVDRLLQE